MTRDPSGALVIGPRMASALRTHSAFATGRLDPGARIRVQVAQTYLTEATAQGALEDQASARDSLEHARALLADPGLARIAVWLRTEVDSELARQDQAAGRGPQARARLTLALQQLRQREAGSSAEAYLVMELARAEALGGDQTAALRDFDLGISLFKSTRGSLGASADSTNVYFNLLLTRIAQDPASSDSYTNRFLKAAESLGSEATRGHHRAPVGPAERLERRLGRPDPRP